MKTIKTLLLVVFVGTLIPMLATNCSNKKTAEKAETTETTTKTESVIKVATPPYQKFIVVNAENVGLYQKADKNSPTLVVWYESDCESDFCEHFYQWSDQPGKPGFDLDESTLAYEGKVLPVLGEEGEFYKVSTISEYCDIESAYIPKASVGEIESAPIKAEMLEGDEDLFNCHVVKDGKYKDIVLMEEFDELNGEKLQVGVLIDGVVATPLFYYIDCSLYRDQKEDLIIEDSESEFFLKYNKSLAKATEEGQEPWQLDPKKFSDEQIAKIVDTVTKKEPQYVNYMYHFPAQGVQSFVYLAK